MMPSLSVPASWLRPACAISRMRAVSSSTFCACSTMRSPTGVTVTSALAPLEQRRAQLFLELLDRHRQGGLAHEAFLRGAAEIALLRDGHDVAQLGERHRLRCGQEPREPGAGFRMLEPEVHARLEIAQLGAAVVAAPLERVRKYRFLGDQLRDAVGQLDFAARARLQRAQVAEDPRRQHVAADDRQRRCAWSRALAFRRCA